MTLDGGKLVHVQKWNGQETSLVREIVDGKLILVRWINSEALPNWFLLSLQPSLFCKARVMPCGHAQWRVEAGLGGIGAPNTVALGLYMPLRKSQLIGYMILDKSLSKSTCKVGSNNDNLVGLLVSLKEKVVAAQSLAGVGGLQ